MKRLALVLTVAVLVVGSAVFAADLAEQAAKPKGWMGVNIGPVPEALAAHLDLDGKGVMVRNVVKGSPADKAQLERYDIILGVGNKEISGQAGDLVRLIRKYDAGDKVSLTVVQKARPRKVSMTLAEPRRMDEIEYKYPPMQDAQWEDWMKLRGRAIQPGPKGWVTLPDGSSTRIPMILKAMDDMMGGIEIRAGEDGTLTVRKTGKKETIEVRRGDNAITVKRIRKTDDGPKTTTKKYKSADELKKADPEAYKVFRTFQPLDLEKMLGPAGSRKLPSDMIEEMLKNLPELSRPGFAHPKGLMDPDASMEKLLKRHEEMMRRFQQELPTGPAEREGAAVSRFVIGEDGKVTVTVVDCGEAKTLTFDNLDEMEKENPDLYKTYDRIFGED